MALGSAALFALGAGIAAGAGAGGDEGSEDADAGAPPPRCPAEIGTSDRRLTGRMLVVRLEGEPPPALLARVRRGEVGGVILFPAPGTDPRAIQRSVARIADPARRAGMPEPLVAIDQEGGEVERLPELPPDRAPSELSMLSPAEARAEGAATGAALAALGVTVDLAPVLDLPSVAGAFIAPRALGDDPDAVAERGLAFATGLAEAGVAPTAKHFPGLGHAVANTDTGPSEIAAAARELRAGLRPFAAAIDARIPLVMTANATYPAIDPVRPASLSPPVTTRLLRDRLGFEGVVITDDLNAGAITAAGLDERAAAVAAARAGADLLLFALSDGDAAHAGLLAALRHGELDRADLLRSCARVTALADALASGELELAAGD